MLVLGGLTVPAHAAFAASAPVPSGTYENTSPQIAYSGSWVLGSTHSRDSESNVTIAKIGGDSAELSFSGSSVVWLGRSGPYMGLADVYIDGEHTAEVDSYAAVQDYQQALFTTDDLGDGNHTIKIVRQGKHSAESRGNDIMLDALVVSDSHAPAPMTNLRATAAEASVDVSWTAAPDADVAGHRVYRRVDGGPAEKIAELRTDQTTYTDATAPVNLPLEYSAAAFDTSGNESAPTPAPIVTVKLGTVLGSGTHENTSDGFTFSGTWAVNTHSRDSGGTSALAKSAGAYARGTFTGNSVELISRTGPYYGIADIYIDDAKVAAVDLYSPSLAYGKSVYSTDSLAAGVHKMRIVRGGTRNAASNGNDIVFDGLIVRDGTAPAAPSNATATASETGVDVSWAAPADIDVDGYRVFRSVDGAPAVKVSDLDRTNVAFVDASAPVDLPITYSVAAVDSSGNVSVSATAPAVTVSLGIVLGSGRHENASDAVTYSGTWSLNTHSQDSGGTSAQAKSAGAYARVGFTGSGVELITRTGPYFGIADVYIDDVKVAAVDTYSSSPGYSKSVFTSAALSEGTHKLRIVRSGLRNTASKGNDIAFDALVVSDRTAPAPLTGVGATVSETSVAVAWKSPAVPDLGGFRIYRSIDGAPAVKIADLSQSRTSYTDGTVPVGVPVTYAVTAVDTSANESSPTSAAPVTVALGVVLSSGTHENVSDSVTFSGTWGVNIHSRDSGGNSAQAKGAGSYARIGFSGNRVEWIARTGPFFGIADVYIDDLKVAEVDLYSPDQSYRESVFRSVTLDEGVHKLRIVRTGTRNAASGGNDIVLDALVIKDGTAPAIPAAVSAAVSGINADVVWAASSSADLSGYRVYRRVDGSTTSIKLVTLSRSDTSFTDLTAPLDVPVTYSVAAFDTSGNASAAAFASGITIVGGTVLSSGRHENTSKGIAYDGSWQVVSHSSDSGGSSAAAKIGGDFAQVVFDQTGIEWIGRTGPVFGIADVFLDGVKVATVDLYSPTQEFRQTLFKIESLAEGAHKLRIVRTGTRSELSRGNDIVLDALVVLDAISPATVSDVSAAARGTSIDLSWNDSSARDLEGYRVYRSDGGAPAVLVAEPTKAESTFTDPTAPIGVPVIYSVSAIDTSGNRSIAAVAASATISNAVVQRSGRYENTSDAVTYTGNWVVNSHSSDNAGSSSAGKASGDYAQIAFDGSGIEWISRTGPYLGLADVYLDGVMVTTVDLYSPTQEFQKLAFRVDTPSDGAHKFRIVRKGTRNVESTGNDIVLDTFIVLDTKPPLALTGVTATVSGTNVDVAWIPSGARDLDGYRVYRGDGGAPAVKIADLPKTQTTFTDPTAPVGIAVTYFVTAIDTSANESASVGSAVVSVGLDDVVSSSPYENTSPSITFTGTWAVNSHSSDSAGSSSAAKAAGDYAQIAFAETGVEWVSRTGPSLGIADVFLDDVKVATVDLYSPVQDFQKSVYRNDALSDGIHKLRIERTGTRNPSSSGNDIVLDRLDVFDRVAPVVPSTVSAVAERNGIRVAWSASSSLDTAGYRLYRALGAGSFEGVTGPVLLSGTDFVDIGLALGGSFRFAVEAVDTSGNASVRSAIVSVDQPDFDPVPTRYSNCPAGGTTVSTLTALRNAVAAAKPGSVIRLAPGTYAGNITVTTSGTATAPIWICGPRTAVLDNNNVAAKNGVLLSGVSHVNVAGFTIQNFRKGVVMSSAHNISLADMMIRNIGEEAVKVRYDTTDSTVAYNTIAGTGLVESMFGEGVYIGTSPKNWCAVFNCKEDNSDRNSVIGNNISGTTAEPIEAKPGTTGGVIRDNRVDGTKAVSGTPLIGVKGNGYLVTDNVGTNGKWIRGIWAAETEVKGYGHNNILARNTISVPVGSTAYYVGLGAGNIVDDSNIALVAGSNLTNTVSQR